MIAFLFSDMLLAQDNTKIDRSKFKVMDQGFKEAWKHLKDAETFFENGPEYYSLALSNYLKAYKYNPAYSFLNYRIGVCFLYATPRSESIHYLKKAYMSDTLVSSDILFKLARAYHLNYDFDTAIEFYNKYQQSLPDKEKADFEPITQKRILECRCGKTIMAFPVRAFVENLGIGVNSSNTDFIPLVSANDSIMYYTSRQRVIIDEKNPNKTQYYENIYLAEKKNNEWHNIGEAPKTLNKTFNAKALSILPNGRTVFFVDKEIKSRVVSSYFDGTEWTKPKLISRKISTKYNDASVSFSLDSQAVYFVDSQKDKSVGTTDIFFINKHYKKNRWTKVKNIGEPINTAYNEGDVFIHPDGRTLFFSSEGHNSMGGYDIFKSEFEPQTGWSEPTNLGYPINTPSDERFFYIAPDNHVAYYSSSRNGGVGLQDIYKIVFLDDEKMPLMTYHNDLICSLYNLQSDIVLKEPILFESRKLTLLKGRIVDQNTFKPVSAMVSIVDIEKDSLIKIILSDTITGRFVVPLSLGRNYGIFASNDDYVFHSENVFEELSDSAFFQEKYLEIKLQPLKSGSKVTLNSVNFENNSSKLKKSSSTEIAILKQMLVASPNIKILILGHTDNRNSLKVSAAISEQKAKTVRNILIKQGVRPERIEYHGCAYLKPIADNNTAIGRKKNNRIEIQIIED